MQIDPKMREEELRIHALGAAISRREWSEVERAHAAIRDEFHARQRLSPDPCPEAGTAGGARVKPLEWKCRKGLTVHWHAHSVVGLYRVGPGYMYPPENELVRQPDALVETAKAAAQADYEARIIAALAASPAATREVFTDNDHLRIAREAYFAAGGQEEDQRRAQKVSRIQIAIRDGKDGVIAPAPESARGEAVAWLHTMHMEGGQTQRLLSDDEDDDHPFGVKGRDYDPSYHVTITPLYAHPTPAPESARGEAVGALLDACKTMADDYQTSEQHHPNHVLVPLEAFTAMRDALAHPANAPAPAAAPTPVSWRDLDDARLRLAVDAFYSPCEGTTIDGVRAAILAWEQSR
jgi:hypothetical protein